MSALALVVALIATAAGTWHVARALGMHRPSDTATTWLLLGTAQLSGLALLVGGVLRQLNAWGLFTGAVVVAAVEIVVVRRRMDVPLRPTVRWSVPGGLAVLWRHPVITLLAGIVLAQYAWRYTIGAILGPLDWDGLWYHITGPALWLRQGHIGHTADVLWADVYPGGQELLTGFSGAFLETTRYAWTSGIPYLLLGVTAIFGLSRSAGASRQYAALGTLAFLSVPAVFLQASTTYVDVGAATTAMAAFQLVIASRAAATSAAERGESARRELYRYYLVIGVALGLAISIKVTNMLVAALVVVVAVIQAWRVLRAVDRVAGVAATGPRDAGLRLRLGQGVAALRLSIPGLLLMGVPMALLGSYWYLRTWIRYGNPFYPFTMLGFEGRGTVDEIVAVPNTPKLLRGSGPIRQTWESWQFDLDRHPYQYDQSPGGFGPQWLYIVLPAILAFAVLCLVKRRFDIVYGLIVPVAVCSMASPTPWWARFQLMLPALGGVCLAALLTFIAGKAAAARTESTAESSSAVASPSRRSGVALGRRALAGTLALAFVGLTTVTMYWATTPTDVWARNDKGWDRASVSQLLDLMSDPRRNDKMLPTQAYSQIRRNVPEGETVAYTDNTSAPLAHLIIGETWTRDIHNLGSPADAADLARRLDKAGARYVMLSEDGKDRALLRQVRNDPQHYRPVVNGDRIAWPWIPGRSTLFEVGDFPVPVTTH